MISRLSTNKRIHRGAFVGGHIVVFAIFLVFIVVPICDFFADRGSRIAEQRVLLARLEAIAAQDANVQSMALI